MAKTYHNARVSIYAAIIRNNKGIGCDDDLNIIGQRPIPLYCACAQGLFYLDKRGKIWYSIIRNTKATPHEDRAQVEYKAFRRSLCGVALILYEKR